MQRFVDNVLAITKESVKTVTYETIHNIVRFINGAAALVLAIVPGKTTNLDGIHNWDLRPAVRGPRLPRFMRRGVSSFNRLIHELYHDSDNSSFEYSDEENDDDNLYPESPSSQVSWGSTSWRYERHWTDLVYLIVSWILLPAKFFMWMFLYLLGLYYDNDASILPPTPTNHQPSSSSHRIKKSNSITEQVVLRTTTETRRGLIEDLHLGVEMVIESLFDILQKAAYFLLSPSEVCAILVNLFSSSDCMEENHSDGVLDTTVKTATLGVDDPALAEHTIMYQSVKTNTPTCQDIVTELGYPYEAIRVVTSDGYVLLLERIPRRDARKAAYFQHGALDSSMGWLSFGVVGSPAFAAYDQGFDVFLGNLRGLVSREHVDKNISSREYWNYSVNELGTEDVPAMIEKLHQIKTAELKLTQPDLEPETNEDQPYKLCAFSHSLGGAVMLTYFITRRLENKPHRLSRLVLLSPAGFHHDSIFLFTLVGHLASLLAPIAPTIVPAFYIPTRFFRKLVNKLAQDFHKYPAVGGLVQTLLSYVFGGDSSNWVGALRLPHFGMNDMPGLSSRMIIHLSQIKHARKFQMYDYGSVQANMEAYGSPEPLDLGECYYLIDVPVDLVAGKTDRIIYPSMVKEHYYIMKEAGVDATYTEFEYAHVDFMYSQREELLAYIISRLLLVDPAPVRPRKLSTKGMNLKKRKTGY